jgi:protein O-GlcNAc transferase
MADAADCLSQVRKLQPRSADILMCLGLAWNALGKRPEALAVLQESTRLAPGSHDAWVNLGVIRLGGGELAEAAACFRRAIELQPKSAQAWTALGGALQLSGRGGESIEAHSRALELEPRHAKARFGRAQAYTACNRRDEALADLEDHLRHYPQDREARSSRLFLLNYLDTLSSQALFAEHCAYGREVDAASEAGAIARGPQSREPGRRLRVAFLSPDLRQHSVAYFLEPLLTHLDRAHFEVVLYHDHHAVDAVSARLRGLATTWRNFVGQSDDVVEAAIRGDQPDVLFDVAGHTGFNRLRLFARRLAPVQIAYLGYPNTTGLRSMDYRLTDAVADPIGATDVLHTERLIRFAPTAWTYAPPLDAPAVAPLPAGLDDARPITFGSFNALSKINETTLDLWGSALAAVPRSRLMVKSIGLQPELWRARLAARGISADRVVFHSGTNDVRSHLECYGGVDIALDTFPYNGTTTTCEALWMGVPVITLAGDRHASRVSASLLTAVGHPEWIATDRVHYAGIAMKLASDRAGLAAQRAQLRSEMGRSALLDHAGQALRFGAAIRAAWKTWCDQSVAAA